MEEPREAKTAPLLSGPLYMFLVPLIHKLLFHNGHENQDFYLCEKCFLRGSGLVQSYQANMDPGLRKTSNQNPATVLVLSTASNYKPTKRYHVLLETLNESDNGRWSLNSWSRRESMVCVLESRENGGQWSGRGLNPQLLSRAASVSNGKTKSTCSSRKTFKLWINK